jgi:hypothetical protein
MSQRDDIIEGVRGFLSQLDADDQAADRLRALREGEVLPANVRALPVRPALPRPSPAEMRRQLWRWAAWARPDGVPAGFREEERPR